MSENEIINIIENFLNYKQEKYLSGIEICAISNLLDLYKQEKEKNNEDLQKAFEAGQTSIRKNYISKDKIRESIKEIENYTCISNEENREQDYAVIKLEELLEEE